MLLKWNCPECQETKRQIVEKRPEVAPLCKNGHPMVSITSGSTFVMEVFDNGVTKKVERHRDINDLRHEHAQADQIKDPHLV